MKCIYLFTNDLRIKDNEGFYAASQYPVLPIYILEKDSLETVKNALETLNNELDGNLHVYEGNTKEILKKLTNGLNISKIYGTDLKIEDNLFDIYNYSSRLWDYRKMNNSYKNFALFYKACLKLEEPRQILPLRKFTLIKTDLIKRIFIGKQESQAEKTLDFFINNHLKNYAIDRNFPYKNATSNLSVFLRFGQISMHTIWHKIPKNTDDSFLKELVWREFSYYLYDRYPNNIDKKMDRFPWEYNDKFFEAWKKGQTGIPIVDAGMRQLVQTGKMPNRIRMICASFLVKNLLIHWTYGERWFFQHLLDAHLEVNTMNWKWIAGCGTDPYFRIFNPILQSEKFDPLGIYIKTHVPELSHLSVPEIFKPQNIINYPKPIVDLAETRKKALNIYKLL